jgi:hypothetical protein
MTAHSNGIGGTFYDCYPSGAPGTNNNYSLALAQDAANQDTSITGGNVSTGASGALLYVCKQNPSVCACWSYYDTSTINLAGRVSKGAMCSSPSVLDPLWR